MGMEKSGLMKKIVRGIGKFLIPFVVAGAFGCSQNKESKYPYRMTVIKSNENNKKIVELFYDFDNDGKVDEYIVGPVTNKDTHYDLTCPDNLSKETKGYLSQKIFDEEFKKFELDKKKDSTLTWDKYSIQYLSEGGTIVVGGVNPKKMSDSLETKVNERYKIIKN